MTQDFRKLDVWKRAHVLVLEIYACAKKLPDSDQEYGVAADICQTALQVPAAIARGSAYEESEFRECLEEARLSLRQVDMQLMIMHRLGFLSESECDRLLKMGEEVREMLIKRIEKRKVAKT
jgi:four helix bundle protein